jgi:hypothetical protein
MSEEEQDEGTPIPGELTPHEERATAGGWQPEADWVDAGKDPADWVDAPEFNVRGELMGRIQGMGRKLNGYEKEIADLRATQKKHSEVTRSMVEATYKKAITDLNRQRREALEVGDYDQLDELDQRRDEMVEKRAEMADEPAEAAAPDTPKQVHPIEQTFLNIINSDATLRDDVEARQKVGQFADTIWGANPDISVLEFTRKLDAHMNPQREAAPRGPAGAGKRQPSRSKSKYTVRDLDEMELAFAKTFVDTEAYDSIQDYIDDAAKSGTLAVQQR